ncbi:MAG: preprotein translocase subunit YajC [Chitinophagaceae bacterium]|nr:preprotein translocase subunit YajC [Chitinophagaceae bacterium]
MNHYLVLLQSGGGNAQAMQMIMLVGIIAVFYFFMIRPQTKKAKEAKNFQNSLQRGDRIVTIAGIHGKIEKIEDNTIQLEVSPGSYLKIEKSAVSMEWSKQLNSGVSTGGK